MPSRVEFEQFSEGVQDEMLARAKVLAQFGPQLGRPQVDDKVGADQERFYEQLIRTADARLDAHLMKLKEEKARAATAKVKRK